MHLSSVSIKYLSEVSDFTNLSYSTFKWHWTSFKIPVMEDINFSFQAIMDQGIIQISISNYFFSLLEFPIFIKFLMINHST